MLASLVGASLYPGILAAQYQNVRVSQVGATDANEVTVAINPVNPLNLAAGANLAYSFVSRNGGETWTQAWMTSSLGVWGDPCVAFDGDGNLYYAHLSNPGAPGYWIDRIVVQKSTDGGATWSDGVGVGFHSPRQQDKEWITPDLSTSPYRNSLYIAWTEFDSYESTQPGDSSRILFSRSTDGGITWSAPQKVSDAEGNCLDSDSTVEGAVPAAGPDGQVYLAWAGPLGIVFDKSTDGGITWGTDKVIADQPGGWDFDVSGISRCNGLPVTVCDISNSPSRGTVYVLWSDQRNGTDDTDVFLTKSTDEGLSWSSLTRVNNDLSKRQQFFPWLTVDPETGNLYVVFYDRRATAGDATDVYVARSTDAGGTWENFPVSDSSFVPTPNIFFGDYSNIAARGGMVYPIWTRMDNGAMSAWITILRDTVTAVAATPTSGSKSFSLEQNYPNPFNAESVVRYAVAKPGIVSLKVYNILGQVVLTAVDRWEAPGAYSVRLKMRGLPTGVYFYSLSQGGQISTRRMILLN
jgi:hypothetical protein